MFFTGQFNGRKALPGPAGLPEPYQREALSPGFFLLNVQFTKRFKRLELYAGGENLTDFTQENPVIAAGEPFGSYFDASMVWGPISGRTFYAGLRYRIE